MIPYADILLIAVVWLTARHYYYSRASDRSKRLVVYLGIASIVTVWLLPSVRLLAALLQLAICAYVILYQTVMTSDGEPTDTFRSQLAKPPDPSVIVNNPNRPV
jgi:hypothetical protein